MLAEKSPSYSARAVGLGQVEACDANLRLPSHQFNMQLATHLCHQSAVSSSLDFYCLRTSCDDFLITKYGVSEVCSQII